MKHHVKIKFTSTTEPDGNGVSRETEHGFLFDELDNMKYVTPDQLRELFMEAYYVFKK